MMTKMSVCLCPKRRGTECDSVNKAWLPSHVGEELVPRKKEGGERGQKKRENRNGAGRVSRVKCRGSLFLTDDEALTIVGNAYWVIPENLVLKKTTAKRHKKRGQVPRCRTCRKIQNQEVTVTDKVLYFPYEQNFVTETMFCFCPRKQYINNLPHWTKLKPPGRIRADSSFTDDLSGSLQR